VIKGGLMTELPDIQETKPKIEIPIHQVGVQNVEVPFSLQSRNGNYRSMIANVSMRTSLDATTKGISMSRLIRTLREYLDKPLKSELIKEILLAIMMNIKTDNVYMKFEFRLPVLKKSPASDNEFPLYYKCSFEGQYLTTCYTTNGNVTEFRFYQGVRVQYASYCPCSYMLCEDLKTKGHAGFPHAQRSFADIIVRNEERSYVWLEDIIDSVETSIKTLPYPIIKREDEQIIAKSAAENPIFVEDAIRVISQNLNSIEGIYDWAVKCTHEESIHTSEAIAMNYKGIEEGFDSNFFL
jgi:GTP cyclohydrolase I